MIMPYKTVMAYNKVICIVTHLYPIDNRDYKGGFVRELAISLCDKGYEVHIVTPRRLNALKKEKINGVYIHRFSYWGYSKGVQLGKLKGTPVFLLGTLVLSGIMECAKVVIKCRANIIHAYWVVPGGLIAMISGLLTNRPVVATAAGSDLNTASRNRIYQLLIRLTLNGIDRLIAVSNSMKQIALSLGLPMKKAVVFPGPVGIDLDLYTDSHESVSLLNDAPENTHEGVLLLYVGNLTYPKRVDTILRAMKIVTENVDDACLMIVGDGDKRLELENLVYDLGINDKVIFKGAVPHEKISDFMHKSHIFVHCSENEGLPVAIMEAMASGLPVAGSRTGGVPELIMENETGYIIDYNDYKGYAEKLVKLVLNHDLRNKMGIKGRELAVSKFSRKIIINKNIEVYEQLMGGGKKKR